MFSQKKPYSAVTVTIENLTGERYEEDDLSGIPELVEAIKLQESGPTEAARAIRKKLKYGNAHRQLRALTILDGLIQNAGARFQRTFADEMLLERLRVMGTAETTDIDVRKKCNLLFRNWAVDYKNTPGLERLAKLHKELPQRKQVVTQARSKVIKETENPFGEDDEDDAPPGSQAGPSHSRSGSGSAAPAPLGLPMSGRIESFSYLGSSKDKKKKDKDKKGKSRRSFNLDAERDKMKGTIADASMASTQLLNSLQTINREMERISENQAAVQRFEACKQLRRRILRYIYNVQDEQWLGSLLHANDELVHALMTYEQLDRSIDADSDSDDDVAEQAHIYHMIQEKSKEAASASPTSEMAGLSLASRASPPQPARPAAPPRPSALSKPAAPARPANDSDGDDYVSEDENDPFADRNAVVTPKVEKSEPRW